MTTRLETPTPPTRLTRGSALGRWDIELVMLAFGIVAVLLGPGLPLIGFIIVFVAAVLAYVARSADSGRRQVVTVSAIVTLLVAIPFTRIPSSGLLLVVISGGLIALGVGGYVRRDTPVPRGIILVAAFVLVLFFGTALSTDESALLRFLPFAASSLPVFAVMGRATHLVSRRIARFIVSVGVVESVVALVEPTFFPTHLWAPAQLGSFGQVVPLYNPLLGDTIERSQATLGHPLALGFLLLVAIALLARSFPGAPLSLRVMTMVLLLAGLVSSGSRNSIVIAAVILVFFAGHRMSPLRAIASVLFSAFAIGLAIHFSWWSEEVQQDFTDSGSFTHRIGAYEALGGLLANQDASNVLFGNGFASTARLFEAGMLQTDGFNVVDNQFILTFAQGGIAALLLLLAIVLGAAFFARRYVRPALLAVVATMLIFDSLNWTSATALTFVVIAGAFNSPLDQSRENSETT